jgi:hypothetical protein
MVFAAVLSRATVPDPHRATTLETPLAPWRSGYAAACKAVYTGSIPVGASSQDGLRDWFMDFEHRLSAARPFGTDDASRAAQDRPTALRASSVVDGFPCGILGGL